MNLSATQRELQQRIREGYLPWGQKQNNHWDTLTNFIYRTPTWQGVKQAVKTQCPTNIDNHRFFAYAANRWFNFWSAQGVEAIFCSLPGVVAAKNPRDRLVDFSINGLTFDHKTSVFPRKYPHQVSYARYFPHTLIEWLYEHQSSQGRQHFDNRLFVILVDEQGGEHWKLRAELLWLKEKIETYMRYFNRQKLVRLTFEDNKTALSDIIWAIK